MEFRTYIGILMFLLTAWRPNHSFPIRHRGHLTTRTGVKMQIYPDKTVKGSRETSSRFAIKLAEIENLRGKSMSIFGVEAQMYLCMTEAGKMYGNKHLNEDCRFTLHELPYHFMTFYRKIGRTKRFIGLTKSGRPRWGNVQNKRTHFTWKRFRRTRTFTT